MRRFFLFYFCFFFSFLAYSQDYKQYLKLKYSEIDSLVMIPYQKADYKQCISYMQAGQEKAKNDFGGQDSVFAMYTHHMAFFYQHSELSEIALPLYLQSKSIFEKVLAKNSYELSTLLLNLALLYDEMGRYEEGLSTILQAKDIAEKTLGSNHPQFATILLNLAGLNRNMGNHEKALTLVIQANKIIENTLGTENPEFANALNNLAIMYQGVGNPTKALPLLIQAKEIKEKTLGKDHPDFALGLNNIGGLYQDMGNYEKALPLYIQSCDIYKKKLGKFNFSYATAVKELASLYLDMGNYDKASSLYMEVREIREKIFGKTHPDYAESLLSIASLYQKTKEHDKAWEYLLQGIQSLSQININRNIDVAWSDSLLHVKFPSNSHLNQMLIALRITFFLLQEDTRIVDAQNKQIIITDLAIAFLEKYRNNVLNDNDKLRMLSQSSVWLDKSLSVLDTDKHSSKAFQISDQNKSVLLLQATKSETAYRLGNLPDSLARMDKKLLRKKGQLEAQLLEERSGEEKATLRGKLIDVEAEIYKLSKEIEKKYPKYHQLKYQQIDVKLEDVQKLLDNHTALIEYVIGDSVVHIFYITKTNVQWEKSFGPNKELSNNIKIMHQSLSNYTLLTKDKEKSYTNYTQNAHWFYKKLLAPVLKDKKNIKNLIIVTDGELGHLPFETFLIKSAPQTITDYHKLHYLMNDYNISYNYSATLWKESKETTDSKNNPIRKSGQILAMAANYDMKLDSSMMAVRLPTDQSVRSELKPLPAARKEVETLQEKYQGFFAFDELASEKTVKERASDFAILHFAMHGILDAKRPVLSSLVFTEDNDSLESNFWQAHEISKMQLNANLVVLSACETGYGKFEAGNGIASLARAFMYAGASALIVSLWQVNDYATSKTMQNLYANLADGMKKDEALRQAKIQYMKEAKGILAHPAFWSPFIMIGNTDEITVQKKHAFSVPWAIGIGALVLGGIAFAMRRKKSVENE